MAMLLLLQCFYLNFLLKQPTCDFAVAMLKQHLVEKTFFYCSHNCSLNEAGGAD